jgi:hypothetical protein
MPSDRRRGRRSTGRAENRAGRRRGQRRDRRIARLCRCFSQRFLPERFLQSVGWRRSGSTQAARAADLQCAGESKEHDYGNEPRVRPDATPVNHR